MNDQNEGAKQTKSGVNVDIDNWGLSRREATASVNACCCAHSGHTLNNPCSPAH